jgi:hypothetical protein
MLEITSHLIFLTDDTSAIAGLVSACEKVAPPASIHRLGNTSGSVTENADVTLYPNPATNELYVDGKDNTNLSLKLYNIIGSMVMDKAISSNEKIDIAYLANGIYTYKLYNGDVELKIGKVIISK